MSWKIGLYLSESFAEISAQPEGRPNTISKFWYLRSKNLADGLREFFDENNIGDGSTLRVSSFWPEMVVQKKIGTVPAILVSAGFEDWLYLRQPKKTLPPSVPPERQRPFFSSDLIFGIAERTDAEGRVQKRPSEEDLEFLHQKFQLSGIQNIAIGFLQSSKNPENEKSVAQFFKSRNYQVWTSHEFGGGLNEVSRWWRCGLEAYVSPTLTEMYAPLLEFCKIRGVKLHAPDFNSLGSSFDVFNRVAGFYRKAGHQYLLWADLRGFTLIDLNREQRFVETLWGPIAANTPRMTKIRLKPTALIENEGLLGLRNAFFDIGFDPGPMCFGRGIKPTLMDMLFVLNYLELPTALTNLVNDNTKDKITESLAVTMRVLLKNEPRWPDFLAGWARSQLMGEIVEFIDQSELVLTGPLAASIAKLIGDQDLDFKISVDTDTDWLVSQTTLGLQ